MGALFMDLDALPLWKVAEWWAKQDGEAQAEFLRLMLSSLHSECGKGNGSVHAQLHSIGKELGRDSMMSIALDLQDIVDASGYARAEGGE